MRSDQDPLADDEWLWVKAKWSKTELLGKKVAFRMTDQSGVRVEGVGVFHVLSRSDIDDRMKIEVVQEPHGASRGEVVRHRLRQGAASWIVENAAGSDPPFSIVLW